MNFTFLIVIVTVLTTLYAFNTPDLYYRLIFFPYRINQTKKEYYRFLTSGFIHADWNHLIFNMLSLYFVGSNVEEICNQAGVPGAYLVLYITAIIISSLPAYFKHKDHSHYLSLGASGGVSAILFMLGYFEPWARVNILFIPFGIPMILFSVLYVAYSAYMSKKGNDNIGHDAHLWGSVYGFVFAFLLDLKITGGQTFLYELMHPR